MTDVWFEEAAPRRKKPAPTARRRKRPLIRVQPEDLHKRERDTYAHQMRHDPHSLMVSVGTSTGVHIGVVGVLFLMYLVMTGFRRDYDDAPAMEMGWLNPKQVQNRNKPRGPVKIPSVQFNPEARPQPRPDEQPAPQEDPDKPADVPVQPVNVGKLLEGRSPRMRDEMIAKSGGSQRAEQAVSQALAWLKRQQQSGGNWQLDAGYPDPCYPRLKTDTGATALALLALLGAGNTPQVGDYREEVTKGLKWLKGIQATNGDFHDYSHEFGRQSSFYAHAQATIAICEAYALTRDESLREPAEKAVRFLIDTQQPIEGGWKYQPQNDRTRGDLSVTGWALMALHTARAAGIQVAEEAFLLSSTFLDTVQEERGSRYKYESQLGPDDITPTMTAEGLLCRQFLGWPREHPSLLEGIEYLQRPENDPRWDVGVPHVYYWYYAGHVLHNMGGDDWKTWYSDVQKLIIENQVKVGRTRKGEDIRGSWNVRNRDGIAYSYADKGGRLYLTAMCVLILEMPYRHMPVYGHQ